MQLLSTLLALTCLSASVTAKANTATIHIYQGRQNSVVVAAKGKLPDVGAAFTMAESSVLGDAEGSMSLKLTGSSISMTGGGYLADAELYMMPAADITFDWEACADLDIMLEYENKSNAKLPVFGVVNDADSNFYFMAPMEMKAGTSIIGRASIPDRDQTAFEEMFETVDAYTTCSMEWMNADGEKQRLEVVFGKDLTIVYIVIGGAMAVLTAIGLFSVMCLGGSKK